MNAELLFLDFFFGSVNLSLQERILIEESFEYCFNYKVPEKYKLKKEEFQEKINEHIAESLNKTQNMEIFSEDKIIEDDLSPPKIPDIEEIYYKYQSGEFKISSEEDALSKIIDQLKRYNNNV